MSEELRYRERQADGEPRGLLILHHGRGADETDLLALGEALDPEQRWHVVAPRAPLQLPGSPGFHWYVVPRVGYPDPETFSRAYAGLSAFHDHVAEASAIPLAQTVLAGFSMGSVMSYATGLAAPRPAPAAVLAFSGFVPTVPGWAPALQSRQGLPVFVVHGRRDPVIPIDFAHRARQTLQAGGLDVSYHESDAAHEIDLAHLAAARTWLKELRA